MKSTKKGCKKLYCGKNKNKEYGRNLYRNMSEEDK